MAIVVQTKKIKKYFLTITLLFCKTEKQGKNNYCERKGYILHVQLKVFFGASEI